MDRAACVRGPAGAFLLGVLVVMALAGCAPAASAPPAPTSAATAAVLATLPPAATTPTAPPAATDPNLVKVPNVHGQMYGGAESKLRAAGLKHREKINAEFLGPADDVQDGGVYKQSPVAGTRVPKGTVVTIYFNIYE